MNNNAQWISDVLVESIQKYSVRLRKEHDGDVMAEGSIIIYPREEKDPVGLVEDIRTEEGSRRQGYGSIVVQKLVDIAKKNGCYKVVLYCQPYNCKFYERAGFKQDQINMKRALK